MPIAESLRGAGSGAILAPWRPGWSPRVALMARVHGRRLDRDLAAGLPSWSSARHSARSVQITSRAGRRSLARSVDRLIERVSEPLPGALSAAVPLDRAAVVGARAQLERLRLRLRDGAPISSQGVAGLRQLLSDGDGPLYHRHGGAGLTRQLSRIQGSLDIRE